MSSYVVLSGDYILKKSRHNVWQKRYFMLCRDLMNSEKYTLKYINKTSIIEILIRTFSIEGDIIIVNNYFLLRIQNFEIKRKWICQLNLMKREPTECVIPQQIEIDITNETQIIHSQIIKYFPIIEPFSCRVYLKVLSELYETFDVKLENYNLLILELNNFLNQSLVIEREILYYDELSNFIKIHYYNLDNFFIKLGISTPEIIKDTRKNLKRFIIKKLIEKLEEFNQNALSNIEKGTLISLFNLQNEVISIANEVSIISKCIESVSNLQIKIYELTMFSRDREFILNLINEYSFITYQIDNLELYSIESEITSLRTQNTKLFRIILNKFLDDYLILKFTNDFIIDLETKLREEAFKVVINFMFDKILMCIFSNRKNFELANLFFSLESYDKKMGYLEVINSLVYHDENSIENAISKIDISELKEYIEINSDLIIKPVNTIKIIKKRKDLSRSERERLIRIFSE